MFSFEIFWLIFSYLLGSIPFGFLIAYFSSRKNILEIGWRKTSGSNVFKNVGKWQGLLTGILDISKGYLAVYGAQRLGFSSEIQIFSGASAITGHNWSPFLRFAGGRGIGTFIGALFALSPQILGISLIPLISLALIWNAAVGTLLFLATAIFLSFYPLPFLAGSQFETAGIFTIVSLAPILIKRLSPMGEIKKSRQKAVLIRNRLLFDNDESLTQLRIKRIFQNFILYSKEKNHQSKLAGIIKPVTGSLLVPPRIGWRATKFGLKMAKKPIGPVKEILSNGVKKLISKTPEKVVTEIGIEDFKKMMIAASKMIVLHQEEINKINVWPVADKDTGYNLAATLLGIEGTIAFQQYSGFRELARDIKEAAMTNARGNVGMIYTGYLIEVLDRIKHLEKIDAFHLSWAMEKGIKAARLSIVEPVEGTILDVIKSSGDKAYEIAKFKKEKNIIAVLEEANKVSQIALKETKEKLQALKENDVVDAGALGFVKTLEAWLGSLKGLTPAPSVEEKSPVSQPELKEKPSTRAELGAGLVPYRNGVSGAGLQYRYEAVLSFKKPEGLDLAKTRNELSFLGGSLEIIETEGKIKLHIHTNQPEIIAEKFKGMPAIEFRIEDMEEQMTPHQILAGGEKKPLGLVVGQSADLPKEFLEKYDIEEVSFTTRFPDGEIINSKEEIYHKMREAIIIGRPLPTTSAPSFKEFFTTYQRALKKFEKILVLTVSSKLSGTYSSARIARSFFKKPTKLDIFVFDCFNVGVGEGLIAIRTQELISQGKKTEEILNELKEFYPKVNLLICFDDFRYIVKGGRVSLPKILIKPISLIQKIGIRPVIVLKSGKLKFSGIRLGKNAAKILVKEVDRQREGRELRVAVAHADNLKLAQELKAELEKLPKVKVLFTSSVTPALGTHVGPGALLVAFHSVDS